MKHVLAVISLCLGLMNTGSVLAQSFMNEADIIKGLIPITGDETDRKVDLYIQFDVGTADLTQDTASQLKALAAAMMSPELEKSVFEINGHTDASGDAASNQKLSEDRAIQVAVYLTDLGIHPDRLVPQGFGEGQLRNAMNPNAAENRRVEIINITKAPDDNGGAITD